MPQRLRLLVIEDNPGDIRMIEVALAEAPVAFDVDVTSTVDEAAAMVGRTPYDAILLDLNLPDSDGMDTFRRIYAADASMPIVVVTVIANEDLAVRAVAEGAQDYIFKDELSGRGLSRAIRYAIERQRLRVELQQLNSALSVFIAVAAHELRTPLSVMAGFARTIAAKGTKMQPETLAQSLEAMDRQAERAEMLVDDLLDLSKLVGSQTDLVPVDVESVVRRALEALPVPEGKEVRLDIEPGLTVTADLVRMERLVVNLLSNAYKYGGSHVDVTVVASDRDVILTIQDDGPGVEQGIVDHLFEHFVRGSDAASLPGSGLGLAMVRQLAEMFGGAADYEPADPGARFIVRIPSA